MNLRKHWTILSRMVGDTPYTSSGLYKKIKNYHSSDLSARLNDMYHMGLIHKVKEKGKNIYFLTERGVGIACESDMIKYLPLYLAYKSKCEREKKLRSSQEESEVKRENKFVNTVIENTPPIGSEYMNWKYIYSITDNIYISKWEKIIVTMKDWKIIQIDLYKTPSTLQILKSLFF